MVTGAGHGIGAATALALATTGTAVALLDKNAAAAADTAARITAIGGVSIAVTVDVADPQQIWRAFDAVDDFGVPSLAVHCAAITGPRETFHGYERWAYERVLAVNVGGVFYCMQAALSRMAAAGGGSIVNVTSGAAERGVAGSAPYSASKHAVLGLTRSAAVEYGRRGIRVNAVSPGYVDTGIADVPAGFAEQQPSGRPVTTDEVAQAICWLVGPGSGGVTGTTLSVDGGLSAAVPGLPSGAP